MAIEFRCPYCAAPIEVGDEAAGKPGRCPRCATRLTVPQRPVTAPPAEAADVVLLEAAEEEPTVAPVPDVPAVLPGALPDPTQRTTSSAVVRRVKRRSRRKSSLWLPILAGGILLGGLLWYAGPDLFPKPLGGEITAQSLESVDLPPTIVSLDRSRLPARQIKPLLEALESEPIPLLSDLMQVQIRGAATGLSISINAGAKTGWYQVDTRQNSQLADYLEQHASELDVPRQLAVDAAAAEFIEQYASIRDGKTSESSVTAYRDRLALNALVRGLGYHVVATVGSRHYPCVAETEDGRLYFLLPRGLTQFEISGRKQGEGPVKFPGKFTVKVQHGVVSTPPQAPTPATEPAVESLPEN